MVAQVREASIFNAVDAMIDGRPEVALRLLQTNCGKTGRRCPTSSAWWNGSCG